MSLEKRMSNSSSISTDHNDINITQSATGYNHSLSSRSHQFSILSTDDTGYKSYTLYPSSHSNSHTMNKAYSYTPTDHHNSMTPIQLNQSSTSRSVPNASSLNLNQCSKSFKSFSNRSKPQYSSSTPINASMIKQCPNMVNNQCQCKNILQQNKAAQRIWSGCYRMNVYNEYQLMDNREIDVAFYDGLYAKLCQYFRDEVDSDRVPTKTDISQVIKCFGGFSVNSNTDILIDKCNFISFWKWFRGTVSIIKDLYRIWENKFPFKMNLFMNRETCDHLLGAAPPGTFILRVSQSQPDGLVLSYSEPTFNRSTNIRHILLIRKDTQQYCTKTNHKSNQTSSLNQLIRTFIKLKFVYTPHFIYKKNHVF